MTTHHFTRTALGAALIASFSHAALRGLWLANGPAHKCPRLWRSFFLWWRHQWGYPVVAAGAIKHVECVYSEIKARRTAPKIFYCSKITLNIAHDAFF